LQISREDFNIDEKIMGMKNTEHAVEAIDEMYPDVEKEVI